MTWVGPSSSQVGSSRWSFSWSVVDVAALVIVEVGVHYFFGRVGGGWEVGVLDEIKAILYSSCSWSCSLSWAWLKLGSWLTYYLINGILWNIWYSDLINIFIAADWNWICNDCEGNISLPF